MYKIIFLICFGVLLSFFACKDSVMETELPGPDDPFNPFDTIDYSGPIIEETQIDSHTFLGLHTYIFSQSCNQPNCHDGTFEPDFRTVQSAYSTLVFHPITKNYPVNPLPYRITPGEPAQSMLYRRITEHNPPNFERMPSSGDELDANLIGLIEEWISDGARDIYGNPPMQTSQQPTCYGLLAYNDSGVRIDTIRLGDNTFQPFIVDPSDGTITLSFFYLDVTPLQDTVFGNQLSYNKIKFADSPFTFENANEMDLDVLVLPELVSSAFSQPLGFPLPYYHQISIDPLAMGFESGDVVYIHTYIQDSDHSEPTEIPHETAQFALQLYFSFQIQ